MFLREAVRADDREAASRIAAINLAVWGDPQEISKKLRSLNESG